MKKRIGFVSNSSSSNFIIAAKKGSSLKAKINIEIDIDDLIEKRITSIDELKEHIVHDYGYKLENFDEMYEDDIDIKNEFDRLRVFLDKGLEILIGSASDDYNGNGTETMICNQGLNVLDFDEKEIEVIEGDGGY